MEIRRETWRKFNESGFDRSLMNLWEEILSRIETKVNRHSFYTWFRPTTFVADDRTSVTVRVPNGLFKDWLTKHYSGVIGEAMSELQRPNMTVTFLSDAPSDAPAVQLGPDEAVALETNIPPAMPGPAGLNPRYTFDTFIVGTRISSPTRPAARSPKRRRAPTTRCSSTAASVWVKPT